MSGGSKGGEVVAFVTVGTTSFDTLVRNVCESEAVLGLLQRKFGVTRLVVQVGRGEYLPDGIKALDREKAKDTVAFGMPLTVFRFAPSLGPFFDLAQVVISHAGAGSMMEAARAECKTLVVVNDELMGNHQWEMAKAMEEKGYVVACGVKDVEEGVKRLESTKLIPLPPPDATKFAIVVEEEFS